MRVFKLTISALLFVFVSSAQLPSRLGLPIRLTKGMEVLDSANCAWLIHQKIESRYDTSDMYLQIIDLRYNTVSQHYRLSSNEGKDLGLYVEGQRCSPYFERLHYCEVIDSLTQYNLKPVWSVVNASFFEKYEDSTQLSFPISVKGKLITTGSSRYGPSDSAVNKYYRKVRLKAMVFAKDKCQIKVYSRQEVSLFKLKDVIVTYDYRDHPANYFAPDSKNRFQLAAIHQGKFKSNYLILLSSTNTTIQTAANYLKNLGVRSSILSLDGGASVFLYNQKVGTILKPKAKLDEAELKVERLPHYFFIQSKSSR